MHPQTHTLIQINDIRHSIFLQASTSLGSRFLTMVFGYAASLSEQVLVRVFHAISTGYPGGRQPQIAISLLSFQPVFITLPVKAHNFHSDSYTG